MAELLKFTSLDAEAVTTKAEIAKLQRVLISTTTTPRSLLRPFIRSTQLNRVARWQVQMQQEAAARHRRPG